MTTQPTLPPSGFALPPFSPPFYLRSPLVQTILANVPMRAWGLNLMRRRARGDLISLSSGLLLQGAYTPHTGSETKGLAILLAGFTGHAESTYMLRTGEALYRAGFEVYRLTYPDHGDTHDLDEMIFHIGRADVVYDALRRIVGEIRTRPVFLVGFSMGGNFAMSFGLRGLPGLRRIVAVSPPFDFMKAQDAIEERPLYRWVLRRDVRASLRRKAELYPHRYDFAKLTKDASLGAIAAEIVRRYVGDQSPADYYAQYTLNAEKLKALQVPVELIASTDDSAAGPVDYESLRGNDKVRLHVTPHGGHLGFVEGVFGRSWYERAIPSLLADG